MAFGSEKQRLNFAGLASHFSDLRLHCPLTVASDLFSDEVKRNVETFAVHKLVLAAGSEFFRRELTLTTERDGETVYLNHEQDMNLVGIRPNVLRLILSYLYSGEVEVGSDDAWSFVETAAKLEIRNWREMARIFVDSTSNGFSLTLDDETSLPEGWKCGKCGKTSVLLRTMTDHVAEGHAADSKSERSEGDEKEDDAPLRPKVRKVQKASKKGGKHTKRKAKRTKTEDKKLKEALRRMEAEKSKRTSTSDREEESGSESGDGAHETSRSHSVRAEDSGESEVDEAELEYMHELWKKFAADPPSYDRRNRNSKLRNIMTAKMVANTGADMARKPWKCSRCKFTSKFKIQTRRHIRKEHD